MQEGSGVPNLQTELKHLDPFKSYCIFSNCKWPSPWRHPCLSCLTCMCMCVCMHACMHVCLHGALYISTPTHTPIHPPHLPPKGVTRQISLNVITLKWIKIFQFCLKIWNMCRLPHLWVGVWFCGLVDGWVFLLTLWYLTAYLKHLSPLQGYFYCCPVAFWKQEWMRTDRFSGRLLLGVSAWDGICPGGVYLGCVCLEGVSINGVCQGGVSV